MPTHFKLNAIAIASLILLGGCNDNNTKDDSSAAEISKVTQDVRSLVSKLALTGDPSSGRDLPQVGTPLVTLGMQLFFSKALSGEMDVACVSCHHPALGGGDALALSIGVEAIDPELLGAEREHRSDGTHFDGGPTVPRNAPTTFNIGLWDKTIFHDGRIESIEGTVGTNGSGTQTLTPDSANRETPDPQALNLTAAQARFPVTSNEEMKGHHKSDLSNEGIRDYLVARLRGDNADLTTNQWLAAFQLGFEDAVGTAESLINKSNVFQAIGEYERSQVFVDNPWRDFVAGDDDAIDLTAKNGAKLFFATQAEGGANCASCHSGDFFTDELYYNIAMPQIGRGKGDGVTGTNDFGRFKVTKQATDKFAFRTPSLLNVSVTLPYGHNGAYSSLEAVVRHHLNPETAVTNYSVSDNVTQVGVQTNNMAENTQEAIEKLISDRVAGVDNVIEDIMLSDEQVSQLMAFLNTLTDKCIANTATDACLDKWVPNDAIADPDGLRLQAKFSQ
jgi:cytochrome c peroxidase